METSRFLKLAWSLLYVPVGRSLRFGSLPRPIAHDPILLPLSFAIFLPIYSLVYLSAPQTSYGESPRLRGQPRPAPSSLPCPAFRHPGNIQISLSCRHEGMKVEQIIPSH